MIAIRLLGTVTCAFDGRLAAALNTPRFRRCLPTCCWEVCGRRVRKSFLNITH
jgi:hypothetical protein